jgi:hypothetical protein
MSGVLYFFLRPLLGSEGVMQGSVANYQKQES